MTREVTIGALMSNPVSVIGEVERGESVVLTRHGEPIAVIIPVPAAVKVTPADDVIDAEIVDEDDEPVELRYFPPTVRFHH